MHRRSAYGATSIKKAPYILPYIGLLRPRSVIDYGCGQSPLADLISQRCGASVTRYDPAIPGLDSKPHGRFDLLISVDVLEHLPEETIDDTLAAMADLSDKAIIIVDSRVAATRLPDGRNAHLTVRPAPWWKERLAQHYPHVRRIWVQRRPASFVTWPISRPQVLRASALAGIYKAQAVVAKTIGIGVRQARGAS